MFRAPTAALVAAVRVIGVGFAELKEEQMDEQQAQPAAEATEPPKGRILGIGGIFFKSEQPGPMRQWYSDHLGLTDTGHGAILPWRDNDDPQTERMTVWSIFPASSKYFESGSMMMNYIVDDLDALLARLSEAGVQIDPKRQDESYGRFAWIYDPDGNKIELWQPIG